MEGLTRKWLQNALTWSLNVLDCSLSIGFSASESSSGAAALPRGRHFVGNVDSWQRGVLAGGQRIGVHTYDGAAIFAAASKGSAFVDRHSGMGAAPGVNGNVATEDDG